MARGLRRTQGVCELKTAAETAADSFSGGSADTGEMVVNTALHPARHS